NNTLLGCHKRLIYQNTKIYFFHNIGVSNSNQYTNNTFFGHSPLTEETLWPGAVLKLNPLNKEQLQSALILMIQNEDSILTRIHEAYILALTNKLNHLTKLTESSEHSLH
ncbi:uncharacterized protein LOC111089842, partial [Limulus polyphemus]|uniref:Uncharacterized protein LOC111089842 n=1 Tax=Limulus polyphemus TaxID=6850 RepID=A0ABM1TS56_LIMPO